MGGHRVIRWSDAFRVWFGMLFGNLLYQVLRDVPDYLRAVEISFFNAWAIGTLVVYTRYFKD